MIGSLDSLGGRHQAYSRRFEYRDRNSKAVFSQAARPRFRWVAYEAQPFRGVYELREPTMATRFVAWPLVDAASLVKQVRDRAVEKLRHALAARSDLIGRVLVGRKANGSNDFPISKRVRIVPLASIGHEHADRAIRRLLVEVPADCPLDSNDIHWAFSAP